LAPQRDWLLERVAAQPSVSVRGLAAELAERGVRAAPVSVWRVLKEAGFSFKKNAVRQRAGQAVDRPATGPVEKVSTPA
jgi:transposase